MISSDTQLTRVEPVPRFAVTRRQYQAGMLLPPSGSPLISADPERGLHRLERQKEPWGRVVQRACAIMLLTCDDFVEQSSKRKSFTTSRANCRRTFFCRTQRAFSFFGSRLIWVMHIRIIVAVGNTMGEIMIGTRTTRRGVSSGTRTMLRRTPRPFAFRRNSVEGVGPRWTRPASGTLTLVRYHD
jgi:hypothetical protein